MIIYVDNILLTGIVQTRINEVKTYLNIELTTKGLGHVDFFMGVEIQYSFAGCNISQHKILYKKPT